MSRIYTALSMTAAGFEYTGDGDTGRCKYCGLEISGWTMSMDPFIIHSQRKPDCPFVLRVETPSLFNRRFSSSPITSKRKSVTPAEDQSPARRQKIATNNLLPLFDNVFENDKVSQITGTRFFNYNTTDLVRCIYCDCTGQQWTPNADDACEVHKKRPPFDLGAKEKSNWPSTAAIFSAAEKSTVVASNSRSSVLVNLQQVRLNKTLLTALCHPAYAEKSNRRASFATWPYKNSPSVDRLVQAGFFYTGAKSLVTCFYCNGTLQNWGLHDNPATEHARWYPYCAYAKQMCEDETYRKIEESERVQQERAKANEAKEKTNSATWPYKNSPSVDRLARAGFFCTGAKSLVTSFYSNGTLQNWGLHDNPAIEHARWFPHCAYAKQLCGDEMYRKIQESKRAQQERAKANEAREKANSGAATDTNPSTTSRQLSIPDESTLSRFVTARLDLPISQHFLDKNSKLSIIKQYWEHELRMKRDALTSDFDLPIACIIGQKQVELIDGEKKNTTIPSTKMDEIREEEEMKRNAINFKEEKEKTIEREKLLKDWPHALPSRSNMLAAGWSVDMTKGKDVAICSYCGVKCDNWEPTDDPLQIHRSRSPFCPFILAKQPIHPSSVFSKNLDAVYTHKRIADEDVKSTSNIVLHSESSRVQVSVRLESFSSFPGGPPENTDALVKSGFYYTGIGTLVRCYDCNGSVNDFHQYSSDQINTKHCERFPYCQFARLICPRPNKKAAIQVDKCEWCSVNAKELAVDPCHHLAVCRDCAKQISTCPICGTEATAFFRIYS